MHYDAAAQDASEHRIAQCRYKTRAFSIGIKHTVYFLKKTTETLCSSVSQRPLDLSQHCEFTGHLSIRAVAFTVAFIITLQSCHHATCSLCCTVRARPPVNLSTHGAGDGGRRLSWSSPYPSSSSLNKNITYQLSHRTDTQDNWTVSIKHTVHTPL